MVFIIQFIKKVFFYLHHKSSLKESSYLIFTISPNESTNFMLSLELKSGNIYKNEIMLKYPAFLNEYLEVY